MVQVFLVMRPAESIHNIQGAIRLPPLPFYISLFFSPLSLTYTHLHPVNSIKKKKSSTVYTKWTKAISISGKKAAYRKGSTNV